jgi:hypothetical protein
MNVRYRVELSQAERDELTAMLGGGKHAARKLKRAQILLAADGGRRDNLAVRLGPVCNKRSCHVTASPIQTVYFAQGAPRLICQGSPQQSFARLPPGAERDTLLKNTSQADTAAHLDEWANSPGLQPPRSATSGLPENNGHRQTGPVGPVRAKQRHRACRSLKQESRPKAASLFKPNDRGSEAAIDQCLPELASKGCPTAKRLLQRGVDRAKHGI